MNYTNKTIEQLIKERDETIRQYNSRIQREVDKEKARYKFSWKRFLLMIGSVIAFYLALWGNEKLFPKTSIWSWGYYNVDKK